MQTVIFFIFFFFSKLLQISMLKATFGCHSIIYYKMHMAKLLS